MKKILLIVTLMVAILAKAQIQMPQAHPWSGSCDSTMKILGLPYHYCMCKEFSNVFSFPLEAEINDTVWYTATLNDLRQGISASWFSSSSVTLDVFAFCSSKTPTYSLTVGPNETQEVDAQKIEDMLSELDKQQQLTIETLTPHIRVYPHNGGSGRVYCYPYNQGPESTCSDPLPIRAGMHYICENQESSYRLDPEQIPVSGQAFIQWKEKKNAACEIWLTLDSCNGKVIGRAKLSDSLHVYMMDSAQLKKAKAQTRPIWLHTKHAANKTGRIYYHINPFFAEPAEPVSKSACWGQTIKQNGRSYTADTAFVDTIWVKGDTLRTMELNLAFSMPETEYDTIYLEEDELKYGYRHTGYNITLYAYGDTLLQVAEGTNTCARRVLLSVLQPTGYEIVEDGKIRMRKQIQEGQVCILIDEKRYNVFGQQIK